MAETPLDPDMAALLVLVAAHTSAPLETTPPAELRAASRARLPQRPPVPVHRVTDLRIATRQGDLRARLYRPQDGMLPIVLFLHGGGWVLCDLDSHDDYCRRLARASGCAVVAVEYRLAPEAPYPAAFEDGWDALQWIANRGAMEDLDPLRIAVAGDSAGGNLAAALAIATRDRKGPSIRHQLLIYPALDIRGGSASWAEGGPGLLTSQAMRWYWTQYAGAADPADPLLSPAAAPSLAKLPEATIITASHDPLRDEAEDYAKRLQREGSGAVLRRYDGVSHGFAGCFGLVAKADDALVFAADRLRWAMGTRG